MVKLPEPRSLQDLYRVKVGLTFPDPETGVPIRVWVAKLSPDEMESIERRALAAKARVLLDREDRQSDTYMAHMAQVVMFDDPNDLVPFTVADKAQQAEMSLMAQMVAEPAWAEDDLYTGLVTAWLGDKTTGERGLQEVWAAYKDGEPEEDPDDPNLVPNWRQAMRVREQLERFNDEYEERLAEVREDLFDAYRIGRLPNGEFDQVELNRLRDRAVSKFVEAEAEEAYWKEFARQRSFYATRRRYTEPTEDGVDEMAGPEFHTRYFPTIAELDGTTEEVKDRIRVACDNISLGALEGKDSQATQGSSPPSESPELAETSAASGPESASA